MNVGIQRQDLNRRRYHSIVDIQRSTPRLSPRTGYNFFEPRTSTISPILYENNQLERPLGI